MILEDLQKGIADRLLWDAYFTEPGKVVAVIEENPMDLATEFDTALAKGSGAAVVVARPSVTPTERVDLMDIAVTLLISENVTLNRAKSGSGKTASSIAIKALALLRHWSPDEDLWAPFLLQNLAPLGSDDDGCDHWTLELKTQTVFDLLVTMLGTERGTAIGDEAGTGLIVSPTSA